MALKDLIRPAPPPPTPAAERPPGITCEKYARGGGKRCLHFQQGGTCALPDEFVCTEWQKHNGPNKRALPVVDAAPVVVKPPKPPPIAHDLFGNPVALPEEPPKPKPAASAITAADAEHRMNRVFHEGVLEAGCNAHGRRKFRDAEATQPVLAVEGGRFLGAMYGKEEDARKRGLTGAQLLEHRKVQIAPIVEDFDRWRRATLPGLLPKDPLAIAIRYYDNHRAHRRRRSPTGAVLDSWHVTSGVSARLPSG